MTWYGLVVVWYGCLYPVPCRGRCVWGGGGWFYEPRLPCTSMQPTPVAQRQTSQLLSRPTRQAMADLDDKATALVSECDALQHQLQRTDNDLTTDDKAMLSSEVHFSLVLQTH